MGVFALFRRKNGKDGGVETAAVTEESQAATAEPAEAEEAEGGTEAVEPAAAEAKAEAVEIPKQQSAEEAADNEAGEGART
ncbi:hypothetical protein [Streptomyces showdoensis]|uniref:Gliding motility protein n=1 Tax=Streptomyces showdoensis TaxID=68268 RepID=A0A2P2GF21_STREW|nr:hypothetical protein [Streptomyces showdoensis]KKZ70108.1 hypothetical protein VO63_30740 [Streptomyces showdoensis]